MLDKIKRYVAEWQMLTSEDCVIVGVSGGADSVCLLLVLLELKKEMGFDVVAVHVNHGLRGTYADADEAYVKRFCEERQVPVETFFVDVDAVSKERKQSTEEAGREVRRECFEKVRTKYNGTKIALAHHQNDNAETFLFRLARGTGLKGLGGMAPVKDEYIRPLLCVDREEIERYLKEQDAVYCTDASNASNEYSRNRIRNQIIPPMVNGVNSRAITHINRTMENMREIFDYLEKQAEGYADHCVKQTEQGYVIQAEGYRLVPSVLQGLLIKAVMSHVCGKEKDLEEIHVKHIEDLFDKQTGRKIDLPYEMEAWRVYDGVEICLRKEWQNAEKEEFFFDLKNQAATFQWENHKISCRILNKMQIDGETLEKSHTKWFDCDIIKHGITIRTRRQGDYITIHPDGRTQKIKTYFINEKIPKEERDNILLVADGNHVLWIVGYRVNCAYQVNQNTKCVLEIHIDKGEENGRDN